MPPPKTTVPEAVAPDRRFCVPPTPIVVLLTWPPPKTVWVAPIVCCPLEIENVPETEVLIATPPELTIWTPPLMMKDELATPPAATTSVAATVWPPDTGNAPETVAP